MDVIQGIHGFIVKTSAGKQLTFAQQERSETKSYELFNSTYNGQPISEDPTPTYGSRHTAAWHLTEIRDLRTDEVITFSYEIHNEVTINPIGYGRTVCKNDADGNCLPGGVPSLLWSSLLLRAETHVEYPVLNQIIARYHRLELENSSRQDAVGGRKIDRLNLYTRFGDHLVRIIEFDYTTVTAADSPDLNDELSRIAAYITPPWEPDLYSSNEADTHIAAARRRCFLTGVQVRHGDESLPPYTFRYHFPERLPHKRSYEVDYWGYYNGSGAECLIPRQYVYPAATDHYNRYRNYPMAANQPQANPGFILPGADRRPDAAMAAYGALERIELPGGAVHTFHYEGNTYHDPLADGQEVIGAGLRIRQHDLDDDHGNTIVRTFTYQNSAGVSSGQLLHKPQFATEMGWSSDHPDYVGQPTNSFYFGLSMDTETVLYNNVDRTEWTDEDVWNYFTWRYSNPISEFASPYGSEVHYLRVAEQATGTGTGHTVYDYHSKPSYLSAPATVRTAKSMQPHVEFDEHYDEPRNQRGTDREDAQQTGRLADICLGYAPAEGTNIYPYPPLDYRTTAVGFGQLRSVTHYDEDENKVAERTLYYKKLVKSSSGSGSSVSGLVYQHHNALVRGLPSEINRPMAYAIYGYEVDVAHQLEREVSTVYAVDDSGSGTTTSSFTYHPDNYHLKTTTISRGQVSATERVFYASDLATDYPSLIQRGLGALVVGHLNAAGTLTRTLFDPTTRLPNRVEKIYDYDQSTEESRLEHEIRKFDANGYPEVIWHYDQPLVTETTFNDGLLINKTIGNFTDAYAYTPSRQLEIHTMPDGQVITYVYDDLLRLASVTERDGERVTTFSYGYSGYSNSESDMSETASNDSINEYNYVKADIFYGAISGKIPARRDIRVSYYDGLGRSIQTVLKRHHKEDGRLYDVVVGAQTYDAAGRSHRLYEAFRSPHSDGRYISDIEEQPYSEHTYYPDPLARLRQVTGAETWQTTRYAYGYNETGEVTLPSTPAALSPGTLERTTRFDANGNRHQTFTDVRGLEYLSRRFDEEAEQDTYRAYDHRLRLITVYPPGSDAQTPDLLFIYAYDEWNNLTGMKIPDQAALPNTSYSQLTYYDAYDRPTFIKQGLLPSGVDFLASVYDEYNRVERTGFFTGSLPAGNVADNTITATINPLITHEFQMDTRKNGFGKLRKQRVRILNEGQLGEFLEHNYTYDRYGRVFDAFGNHHLNLTYNLAKYNSYSYDQSDQILDEYLINWSPSSQKITFHNKTTLDHAGRVHERLAQLHIDDDRGILTRLSKSTYTARDKVKQLSLGSGPEGGWLQQVDYAYLQNDFLSDINDVNRLDSDLFALHLDYSAPGPQGIPQYNGNISSLTARTASGQHFVQQFTYDGLNRLLSSQYIDKADGGQIGRYKTQYIYNQRGNVDILRRWGRYNVGNQNHDFGQIDELSFQYHNGTNRLKSVTDAVGNADAAAAGFRAHDRGEYQHDPATGNLTYDPSRDHSIQYNHLNLPHTITKSDDSRVEFMYSADGQKLQERRYDALGDLVSKRDYLGPGEYEDGDLMILRHPHGRLVAAEACPKKYYLTGTIDNSTTVNERAFKVSANATLQSGSQVSLEGGALIHLQPGFTVEQGATFSTQMNGCYYAGNRGWRWEYFIPDHLGNNRVLFADLDYDGQIHPETEILQETHYYAFGMEMEGAWSQTNAASEQNRYRYNGIERNDELGLDLAEFRTYDPSIGRWLQVDPMAEYAPGWTPYRFGFNNPILYSDPFGLFETRDEAEAYAEENGIKTGWFRRNKINENTDADGNTTYSIDNRKERSSTMSFDDGDGGRVVVTGALALEKKDRNAGALAVSALVVSQADSPAPGPADVVAVGMLATAGVMAVQNAIPLPTPDFSLPDNIFQANRNKDDHMKGGKKSSRDKDFGITDPNFWKWWHRAGKKARGKGDIRTKDSADEIFKEWIDLGKPSNKG